MPLKGWENTKGFSSSEPLPPSKSRYPPSVQTKPEPTTDTSQSETMPSSMPCKPISSNTSSCGEQDTGTMRTLAISKTHRTKHRQIRFATLVQTLPLSLNTFTLRQNDSSNYSPQCIAFCWHNNWWYVHLRFLLCNWIQNESFGHLIAEISTTARLRCGIHEVRENQMESSQSFRLWLGFSSNASNTWTIWKDWHLTIFIPFLWAPI